MIEILFLLVGIAWIVGVAVQIYRWRQDVLYGPYIRPDRFAGQVRRDQMHRT